MHAKEYIRDAFYSLGKTHPISKISILSIIKKAGINRSTFYYYYEDKQALIESLQNEMLDCFFDILTTTDSNKDVLLDGFTSFSSPEVYASCCHVQINKQKYKIWFEDMDFLKKFSIRLIQYLSSFSNSPIHCSYYAYGTIGYYHSWIQDGCPGDASQFAEDILNMSSQAFLGS